MNIRKGFAIATCAATLTGCSAFMYPDGPTRVSHTRPVPLNEAIEAVEKLETRYLGAAGEQATADKLVKGSLFLASATAIGGALYGAHRDIVTGAAFGGATIFAGSTLFGSPQQRAVYRSGAQALSCAITAVAPLTSIDAGELETAYADLVGASRDYGSIAIGLENAIDAVPKLSLENTAYEKYYKELGVLDGTITKLIEAVDAALADSGASAASVRTKIRNANTIFAGYRVESIAAKTASEVIKSTEQAVNNAKNALQALKRDSNYASWMNEQIDAGISEIDALAKLVADLDQARTKGTKAIIDANTVVRRARIDHQGWRLLPVIIDGDRKKAAKIIKELKDAGSVLFDTSKNIHLKVLGQLERLEPDHAAILRAFSSVIGVTLSGAKSITADRDSLIPRGGQFQTLGAVQPVSAMPPPPVPAGSPAQTYLASVGPDDTAIARAELQKKIDKILDAPALPKAAQLVQQMKWFQAVAVLIENKIEDAKTGLKSVHTKLRKISDQVREAHLTIRVQVDAVQNIDLTTIETTCAALIDPGVKPLKTSTNQIFVESTGEKFLYLSGGRGPYSVLYDKPAAAISVEDGYDPNNGKRRYTFKAASKGFKAGETYTLTILDDDDRKAVVTVTTR